MYAYAAPSYSTILFGHSIAGVMFLCVVFTLVVISLVPLVFPSEFRKLISSDEGYFAELYDGVMVLFTLEYLLKLFCAPFCRSLLRDERMLLKVVVPQYSPNAPVPEENMSHRLVAFVADPSQIIDLFAVIPFWLWKAHSVIQFNLNLTVFRMLRLTRVFRVIKLINFSAEAHMIGSTLARSGRELLVIVVYLLVMSLIVAGLIYQFEVMESHHRRPPHDDEDMIDENVRLLSWAAALLTNTQDSLALAGHYPTLLAGQLIVRCVGLVKCFVFLLPLGAMSAQYKALWEDHMETRKLKRSVKRDERTSVDSDWMLDADQPWGRVEVVGHDQDGIVGAGYFNVPLLQATPVEATLCKVQVRGRGLLDHPWKWPRTRPEVQLIVQWRPAVSAAALLSGELGITLLQGFGFPASRSGKWRCLLHLPTGLCSDGTGRAMETWETDWSFGSGRAPVWRPRGHGTETGGAGACGCTRSFVVEWRAREKEQDERDVRCAAVPDQAALKQQLLGQLQQQTRRLSALQRRRSCVRART
ncbi:unnamed protein product [Prorocentrum cordatum]|uniref:Ion transport domain-containing protein n=1 Tax=Prorocentrum cordatum TaxID=2364126 RepID=A0ABN9T716_9DINO|nr:unnamed protein product [Polarella glacialis]